MTTRDSFISKTWQSIHWGTDKELHPLSGWLYKTNLYETGDEKSILILVSQALEDSVPNILSCSLNLLDKHSAPLCAKILIVPDNSLKFDFNTTLSDFYYGTNITEKYLYKQIENHAPDAIIVYSESECTLDNIAGVPLLGCASDSSELTTHIEQSLTQTRSQLRTNLSVQIKRNLAQVIQDLASSYGQNLTLVNYTQGVGIYSHLIISEHLNDIGSISTELDKVLSTGPLSAENPFGDNPTGANLASSIWAYDLSKHLGTIKWNSLLDEAANLYEASKEPGVPPKPCDPIVRTEDMFYSAAILGRAYQHHGDVNYLDTLDVFFEMVDLQQDNGLFWHSATSPYFWSRGNGFAILGLRQYLTYVPHSRDTYSMIRDQFIKFFKHIHSYQDVSGGFHELLDIPGSYLEFTSTCIIGYAALRGKSLGILDSSVDDLITAAWNFVKQRIDSKGNITDACFNTGLQPDLESYYLRPAVTGQDDRSGSMALLFCSELLRREFNVD